MGHLAANATQRGTSDVENMRQSWVIWLLTQHKGGTSDVENIRQSGVLHSKFHFLSKEIDEVRL